MYDYDYEEYDDEPRGMPKWILPLGIAVGIIFLTFLAIISPQKPRDDGRAQKPKDRATEVDAWGMAKQFVSGRLKSPGSADWGHQRSSSVVERTGEKTFRVRAWVDSQNGFGALIRTNFICELEYLGKDEWKCTRLQLFER